MEKLNCMRVLERARIPFAMHHFAAEHLSAIEVAAQVGVDPARVYKTLVAIPAGSKPVLAMLAAPSSLDLKSLARVLGVKQVTMATQSQAESLTGLRVGGIGALALLSKGWRTVLDRSALTVPQGSILVSAGRRGINLEISVADLIGLLSPIVADVSLRQESGESKAR